MSIPSPLTLIGGRWAVSLRVWVIVSLLIQIPSIVRVSQFVEAPALAIFVPGLIGALALGAVLLIADRTILRLRTVVPVNGWIVIMIWSIGALARALASDLALAQLAPGNSEFTLSEVVAVFIAILGWMWLLSTYFAINDYYRASSIELLASKARLLKITDQQLGDEERLRASLSASIEEALLPTIAGLTREVSVLNDRSSQQELLTLAERAGGEARNLVRGVSHGISGGEIAAVSGTDSIEGAEKIRNERAPWLVSVVWAPLLVAVSVLPKSFAIFGSIALVRATVAFAAWFGACLLLRLLQNKLSGWRPVNTFGFLLVSNLLAIGAGIVATMFASPDWLSAQTAMRVVGLCIAVIVAGLTAAAMSRGVSGLRNDTELLAEQNRYIAEETVKLEDSIGRLRRQVAQVLHGPVQGRLAAVALSLHLFVDGQLNGRVVSSEVTFRRCRALLEQANIDIGVILNGGPESIEPIDVQLRKLAQRWVGLIDVDYSVSVMAQTKIDAAPALASRVGSVIEEAINNAVTHGRAAEVSIVVDSASIGGIHIHALDNGQGLPREVVPGFGLRDIQAVSEAWSLSPGPGQGALLEVTLPYLPLFTNASIAERVAHA